MNSLDWLLHPALQFGLLVLLALGLYLNLFFTMRREARLLEARRRQSREAVDRALEQLRGAIEEIGAEIRELAGQAGLLVAPKPARSGLNLNKRGLALRMYRRGDGPEEIARALELPGGEVELLLKVHRTMLRQF